MKMLIKMIILSLTFFSFSALADKVTLKFHTFVPAPANPNGKDFGGNAAKAAIALLRIKQGEIITTIDVNKSE